MEVYEWIFLGVVLTIIIGISAMIITKVIIKPSMEKMRISTYFWFKSAKVTFRSFDSFATHSLLVSPRQTYEVVYKLETEEGEVRVQIYGKLDVSTRSKLEGREIIQFDGYRPIVDFQGDKAKNGMCSVKLYKKR